MIQMMFKSRYTIQRIFQICVNNFSCQRRPETHHVSKPFLFKRHCSSNNNIHREQEEINELENASLSYRGRYAINMQETTTRNLLDQKNIVTENDWAELFEKLSDVEFPFHIEQSRDSRNLEICYSLKKLNAARTYLIYMKKIGKKYNPAVVSTFIKLCYECREECTKGDVELVKKFTNYLITKYSSVMDNVIAEPVIKGLCFFDDWEPCRNIFEKVSKLHQLNTATRSAYIVCLLNHNQLDLVLETFKEWCSNKIYLENKVLIKLLNAFKNDPEKIIEILKMLRDSDFMPKKIVCDQLLSVFSSLPEPYQLKGTYVDIANNGKCPNCREELSQVDVSEKEFETVREVFLNQVLIGTDVFRSSNPEEFEDFVKCIEKNAPFDVIIDGLNVMFLSGIKNHYIYTKLLTDTVRYFVKRGKKILLIGRKHMNNLPSESMKFVKKNSTLFLVDDLTKDDLYMIYATLYSGPDAVFVTRDFLRTEKFKLADSELLNVFKRWQQSRQLYINFISASGHVNLKNLCKFQMNIQSSKKGWHIPYNETESVIPAEEYGVHKYWLCLKK